jgi:hypothetical protein
MVGEGFPDRPTLPPVDDAELYAKCRTDGACMRVTGNGILDAPACTELGRVGMCAVKLLLGDRPASGPDNYAGYSGVI